MLHFRSIDVGLGQQYKSDEQADGGSKYEPEYRETKVPRPLMLLYRIFISPSGDLEVFGEHQEVLANHREHDGQEDVEATVNPDELGVG